MKPTNTRHARLACLLTTMSALASIQAQTIVFSDDFEAPDVDGYNVSQTSKTVPTNWVRSNEGFNSSRSGLVDDVYETTGWADTDGQQAWAGRYSSNTGISTAEGTIGTLTTGQIIKVDFTSMIDTQNSGSDIRAFLVVYDTGVNRTDFRQDNAGTAGVLARLLGTATATETGYSFSYTVGDDVIDNNGATGGGGVAFDSALLGKDIGIRFAHKNDALIDNVEVEITDPPADTDPPNPDPMSFEVTPVAASATSITMTATEATDAYPSNPVEYFFENTTLVTNSGWTTDRTWVDTGLTTGLTYNYRVKARDAALNETAFSASVSASPSVDGTAPEPNPPTWAATPSAQAAGSLTMEVSPVTDAYPSNPVEYFFENTTLATDSGWSTDTTWTETGLTEGASYDYRVKARDAAGNETALSAVESGTVEDLIAPDSVPTFAVGPKPASGTSVTMTATEVTDAYPSGPVEYFFENTTNAATSGWSTSTTWTDTGLTQGDEYVYQVKARDAAGNETAFSSTASAIPEPDTAAPTPDPMTFAADPFPSGTGTISMTANPATDAYGSDPVEYYFENTTNTTNSGWITSNSWSQSGLTAGVAYTYQVKARDVVNNETGFSAPATATAKTFAIAFSDGFEDPDVDGYTIANTSTTVPGDWVRSNQGFNSNRSGLVDDVYETSGWDDPDGQQAWAGRYSSNTGISTAQGVIGALATGQSIVVNFNSMIDTQNGGSTINAYLVTYDSGADRSDFRQDTAGAFDVLARLTGSATGTQTGYTFSYTVGDDTWTGGGGNGSAVFDTNNLGKDIGLRFKHSNGALIDDVEVLLSTGGGGGPSAYDAWAAGPWSGTLTDPNPDLDFDGGGLETGIEWVVGGDPTDPADDAANAPTIDEDGTYLIFTYNRRDEANEDPNTTITVEYGSDLTGWTTAQDGVAGVIITPSPGSPADSVEVKIPVSLAQNGKLFARLDVVVATP